MRSELKKLQLVIKPQNTQVIDWRWKSNCGRMESLFNQTSNSSLTNSSFLHQNNSFPLSHLCKYDDLQCQSQQGESSWVRWWKAMEGDQIPFSLPSVSISLLILALGLCLNFILVLLILRTVARAKGESTSKWGARAKATTVTIPDGMGITKNKNNGNASGTDTSISSCSCTSTSILCDCCLNCLVLKGANFGNSWTGNNNNDSKKMNEEKEKEKEIDFERRKQYYRISYGCRDRNWLIRLILSFYLLWMFSTSRPVKYNFSSHFIFNFRHYRLKRVIDLNLNLYA